MWMKLFLTFIFVQFSSSELTGEHLCPEEERYVVNVTRFVVKNVTVRDYQWCLQVPPRCSFYAVKSVNVTTVEEEEKFHLVNKCCEGYKEDNFKEKCVSVTCLNCTHGRCIEDEWCDCEPGFEGLRCDEVCDSNHWGKSCRNRCQCERGICDSRSGECICPPRWNGSRCEICAEGHAGEQCNCSCNSTTACDQVTNKCTSASVYESEANNAVQSFETDIEIGDFRAPENFQSAYREPVLQKYYTFDLTTPNHYEYTTKIPKNYSPARKKSTSFPYSYFSSTEISKLFTTIASLEETEINATQNSDASLTSDITTGFLNGHKKINDFHDGNYRKNKQELAPVRTEIEHSAITQLEQKAKAFQMNVSSANAGHVRDERFLDDDERPHLDDAPPESLPINGLMFSVLTAVLVTLTILILVGVTLACLKLKRKVIKFGASECDGEVPNKLPTVSVTTNSIFHTPLPEPPLFENPVFSTPFEGNINQTSTTFEARVICSMNFPKQAISIKDAPDLFYDHPPSTGSYRAVSLPEPPDSENEKSPFDPIYDEIPCCKKLAVLSSRHTSDLCLYMNHN